MAAARLELDRLEAAWSAARDKLIAARLPGGWWEGELSASALSTAVAASALALHDGESHRDIIAGALGWLADNQNTDGGWGDTVDSPSNLPTTMLARAAFNLGGGEESHAGATIEAGGYIGREAGETEADRVAALTALYEPDRTFVVPILCNLALAGQVEWGRVASLPFEVALLPRCLYRAARMHVVSYALPALISLGQLIHERSPSKSTAVRWLRSASKARTLRLLERLQPESGGFIEAIPLTSFMVMGLIGAGHADNPVVTKGIKFLEGSRRADGSWPIDSNLSTWVTTGSVSALSSGGSYIGPSPIATKRWLIERQFTEAHPYTGAARGGWAWTHLPGGVPDADDTAGALLALGHLGGEVDRGVMASGIKWLLALQNSNGGWPTFCRGWGKLEFDRSAPDLTAHAMRAIGRWASAGNPRRIARALAGGFGYLESSQRPDGSWTALWFGSQGSEDLENPIIGTARALQCYRDLSAGALAPAKRAIEYLVNARNSDEGWGGCPDATSTVEETALAVDALAAFGSGDEAVMAAVEGGARWLTWAVEENRLDNPSPVGLYFARLWYAERLYPVMWTVSALGRALAAMSGAGGAGATIATVTGKGDERTD